MFRSKKDDVDFHQEMSSDVFKEWFKKILDLIPINIVKIMDNASYHNVQIERVPIIA